MNSEYIMSDDVVTQLLPLSRSLLTSPLCIPAHDAIRTQVPPLLNIHIHTLFREISIVGIVHKIVVRCECKSLSTMLLVGIREIRRLRMYKNFLLQ